MYAFSMIACSFVLIGFGIYLNLLLGINLDPKIMVMMGLVALTLLNFKDLSKLSGITGSARILQEMGWFPSFHR